MGFFGKLLRKEETPTETRNVECPHKALTARWDRSEDIGKEERATSFRCEACGGTFSGDEGRELLHSRMTLVH